MAKVITTDTLSTFYRGLLEKMYTKEQVDALISEGGNSYVIIGTQDEIDEMDLTQYPESHTIIVITDDEETIDSSPVTSWAASTDANIADTIDAYYNDEISLSDVRFYWKVGDTRQIKIGEVTYKITIVGFNCDKLATPINGHTNALVTCKIDVINAPKSLNTTSANWRDLAIRTWLNGELHNGISITDNIKPVIKSTYNMSNKIVETTDNCWLFSSSEVKNSVNTNEGALYDYFKIESNRIQYLNMSTTVNWWLRTLATTDGKYSVITTSGDNSYDVVTGSNYIVAGFCM